VTTIEEAQKPVLTMLLPVKGLRHDEQGELTADAVKIVTDGMLNLGVSANTQDAKTAIVLEIKKVLCTLNAQYEFLLTQVFESVDNSEPVSKPILESIKEKNRAMRDIISVSRQILKGVSNNTEVTEGVINSSDNTGNLKKTLEAFQNIADGLGSDSAALDAERYSDVKRSFEISVENNKSISTNLALYSFLNVIAVGLLFYIVSAK